MFDLSWSPAGSLLAEGRGDNKKSIKVEFLHMGDCSDKEKIHLLVELVKQAKKDPVITGEE